MKKSNKLILIIRIISIFIIIYCLIYIFLWLLENKKNSDMIKKISDLSIIDSTTIEIPANSQNNTNTEITAYKIDFNSLLSINNSTVGWITVPNTTINYPVTQHSDNKFYLNHSFDKKSNSAGWIFADYRNKFDGTDKNIILYGHNRLDSSMFASLTNTQKEYWYTNHSNRYITFTTPSGTIVYETFSIYTIKSETYYLTTSFSDDESYLNFLNTLTNRSIHNFNVALDVSDNIITLSTCDSTGKSRVILHAKQIN